MVLGMGFDSPGQVIYGTNTKLLGVPLAPLDGVAQYDFDIERTMLGEGTYSVHGAVADGAGAELHRMRDGARLIVTARGTEIGLVTLDPTLSPVRAATVEVPASTVSLSGSGHLSSSGSAYRGVDTP